MPTQSEDPIQRLLDKDVSFDDDVCAAFDCTKRTLQRWVRLGEIPPPASKTGNKRNWTSRQWRKHFGLETA